MTIKTRLLLALLLAAPAAAHGVGLGDIHLGSGLNQPLNADIELLGATPEELTQLRAAVASREIFARYGLDRPAFLSGLTFKIGHDAAGRNVLTVHTADAVGEPFVTFLVELSWPRGHLIREYTVLLDPPVFESTPTAAPAMAAPVSGTSSAPASGTIERTPVEPMPAPAPVATTPAAPAAPTPPPQQRQPAPAAERGSSSGGEYTVVPNDSLSMIVRRQGVSAFADVNRLMIATFRANPSAFDGNINRLHRGAVLRIPPESEWAATDAHDASAEVSRQVEAWRGATGGHARAGSGASEGPARLKLVVPKDTHGAGKEGAAPKSTPAPAPRDAAAEKAREDARRLLDLRNAELARLQLQAKVAPKPVAVPPPPKSVATTPVPAKPVEAAPAPVAPVAAPVAKKPAPVLAAEPGLLDGLFGDNGLFYAAIGVLIALGAGVFGYRRWRRSRSDASDFDDALQPHVDDAQTDPNIDTQTMAAGGGRRSSGHGDIVVEETEDTSGEYTPPPFRAAETQSMRRSDEAAIPVDSRLTAESSIGLDQADPLAEADFHMAYGLYDQAADIVRLAIEREPGRRDLQLKLLEVYFVWGNKDAFLDVARTLARGRDEAPASEWDKVAIMGRQIAAGDPLFVAARDHATSGADIDLDLDAGGTQGIDLELLGDSAPHPSTDQHGHADHRDGIDLDLGRALSAGDPTSATGESPTIDPDRFDLLLEPEPIDQGAATQELPARADAATVEQPMFRRSAFEEAPTVETPAYDLDSTLMQKLHSVSPPSEHGADPTAEMSIEDLGFDGDLDLDTGTLGTTATVMSVQPDSDEPTIHPADAATMVAGLDTASRSLLDAADAAGSAARDTESTRETPRPAFADEATQRAPRIGDAAPTELLPGFESQDGTEIELSGSDLDLDLDELARALENDTVAQPRRDELRFSTDVFATGIHKAPAAGMDLDVGAPLTDHREPTVTERMPQDLDLPDLEPVTLSEVGTKLDLARAYMDMGDPDGARSILQEVLSEGSASQKVEAQRLIETLPR